MSVTELQERLTLCRKKAERQLEARRDRIISEREKKNAMIHEALERIGLHRNVNTYVSANTKYVAQRPPRETDASAYSILIENNVNLNNPFIHIEMILSR
ncbi:unnamed protein product [Echinostoma caproni]|uniref:Uncharacterized protein n=1 Tax=Echinostoma caproni TaxID=27848 RepID=A0A183A2L4_9TREM|nr:unnamed protein product [Echinostoma caproni]